MATEQPTEPILSENDEDAVVSIDPPTSKGGVDVVAVVVAKCTGYGDNISNDAEENTVGCPRPPRDYVGCSGYVAPNMNVDAVGDDEADDDDDDEGVYGLEFGYEMHAVADLTLDDVADARRGLERRMLDLVSEVTGLRGCSVETTTTTAVETAGGGSGGGRALRRRALGGESGGEISPEEGGGRKDDATGAG